MAEVQLDPEEPLALVPGGHQAGTRAAERVEYQATVRAKRSDDRPEHVDGLLGGVQPVSGVLPAQHVNIGDKAWSDLPEVPEWASCSGFGGVEHCPAFLTHR